MKRYIKASFSSGLVGLWWYDEETHTLISLKCDIESGCTDQNGYIQYQNAGSHLTEWRAAATDQLSEDRASEVVDKGYKALERGRVVYDPTSHMYYITCGSRIASEFPEVIDKIINDFMLSGCKYETSIDNHYHKAPLTGNRALDAFEYYTGR